MFARIWTLGIFATHLQIINSFSSFCYTEDDTLGRKPTNSSVLACRNVAVGKHVMTWSLPTGQEVMTLAHVRDFNCEPKETNENAWGPDQPCRSIIFNPSLIERVIVMALLWPSLCSSSSFGYLTLRKFIKWNCEYATKVNLAIKIIIMIMFHYPVMVNNPT